MVVTASRCEDASLQQVLEDLWEKEVNMNATKYMEILEDFSEENCDVREDFFSSNTMSPSRKPQLHTNGFKTTTLMSWSGRQSPDVKPVQNWLESGCSPNATWQSQSFEEEWKNGKLQCPDVQNWKRPFHTDSRLALLPKVHLLYWLGGGDYLWKQIFCILIFIFVINFDNN